MFSVESELSHLCLNAFSVESELGHLCWNAFSLESEWHSVMDQAEPAELKPLRGECGGLAVINFKISGEQGTQNA